MTEPDGTGPTATSDALAGTRVGDRALGRRARASTATTPLVVAFGHDGRVSGSTGVNQLTASYSLTADYLTFGPLATTRRAGTPELMEQEHRVVAVARRHVPVRAHRPHPVDRRARSGASSWSAPRRCRWIRCPPDRELSRPTEA